MEVRHLILLSFLVAAMAGAASASCGEYAVSSCVEKDQVQQSITISAGDVPVYRRGFVAPAPLGEVNDWTPKTVQSNSFTAISQYPGREVFVAGEGTVDVSGLAPGKYVLILWGCTDDGECGWTKPRAFEKVEADNSCDTSSCTWVSQSCGGGTCEEGKVLEERVCSDSDCTSSQTRCTATDYCETTVSCSGEGQCPDGQVCDQSLNLCVSSINECKLLRKNGPRSEKADILFIGKDYSSAQTLQNDIAYYLDHPHDPDGPSGLLNQPPFDQHADIFNIWYINAGDDISDYDEGMYDDVWQYKNQCPQNVQDYTVVMGAEQDDRGSFAAGEWMFMSKTRQRVQQDNGPVGFAHEWGHHFIGLADEYYGEKNITYSAVLSGTVSWKASVGDEISENEVVATVSNDVESHDLTWSDSDGDSDDTKILWQRWVSDGEEIGRGTTVATLGGRDATPSASEVDNLVNNDKLTNCVDTREQAERVWGHLVENPGDGQGIGYYRGCGYNHLNWRPHKSTIMGNGGNNDYGGVGNRMAERVIQQYE